MLEQDADRLNGLLGVLFRDKPTSPVLQIVQDWQESLTLSAEDANWLNRNHYPITFQANPLGHRTRVELNLQPPPQKGRTTRGPVLITGADPEKQAASLVLQVLYHEWDKDESGFADCPNCGAPYYSIRKGSRWRAACSNVCRQALQEAGYL